MRRAAWLALASAVAILGGCSSAPAPPTPAATAPAPSAAPPPAPPSLTLAPAPAPRDQCGLTEARALVGKLRTEIPVPVDPARQRVACTTCPVTQDSNASRLNFFFDAATGVIREVRCG